MNILFIGAHTDDIEIGAGGTLHYFAHQSDVNIHYLSFSLCQDLSRNRLIKHDQTNVKTYLQNIGVNVEMFDLRNRFFPDYSVEIRSILEVVQDRLKPDMVFTHWMGDIHQDHKTVAEESRRVFKTQTLLSYEIIRSSPQFTANFFVSLNKEEIDGKIKLLSLYNTQRDLYYVRENTMYALAQTRAAEIDKQYAEGFNIIRIVQGI
ncbi:MAG: PIG-L family deacetylase [bacterium]